MGLYQELNFLALAAAFIAFLSPDKIFSAPTFLPLVGQPYFALNIEHPEKKAMIKKAYSNFFIILLFFDNISTY